MTEQVKPKSKRGFASMDPERQREIARKGGASVKAENRSFSKDRQLATAAGRKGGEAPHTNRPMGCVEPTLPNEALNRE